MKIARFRFAQGPGPESVAGPDPDPGAGTGPARVRSGLGVLTSPLGDAPAPGSPDPVELADLTDLVDGAVAPLDVARLMLLGGAEHLRATLARAPRRLVPLEHLMSPVPSPGKFLAIGYNYRAHADEAGAAPDAFPLFFNKQVTCISGPRTPIPLPAGCDMLDYEGELAFVVGRSCKNVPVERAGEVIGGWTACNDVSARDWQRQSPTITMGKSHDGFGPTGPWLVTPDEIEDPHDLQIRTLVNGSERQCGTTADMIHSAFEQIAVLSSRCSLRPGDMVTTGSPAGSAQGRLPPPWLRAGDVVRVEVEGVGVLENQVVNEGPSAWIDPGGSDGSRSPVVDRVAPEGLR